MASQPPGLHSVPERSAAPSRPVTASDGLCLRDRENNETATEREIRDKTQAKLLEAMAGPQHDWLPNYLRVTPSGRIQGGAYPPEFYEYTSDLDSGTWEDGLKAIDEFDWDHVTSEKHRSQDVADNDAKPLTSCIEQAQTRALPPSDASRTDVVQDEPLAEVGMTNEKPETSISMWSPTRSCCDESTTSIAQPPMLYSSLGSSECHIQNSALHNQTPTSKNNNTQQITIATVPPEYAIVPLKVVQEYGPGGIPEEPRDEELPSQFAALNGTIEPPPRIPDQAVPSSDKIANQFDVGITEGQSIPPDEGFVAVELHSSPGEAGESEAKDYDSLFEDSRDEIPVEVRMRSNPDAAGGHDKSLLDCEDEGSERQRSEAKGINNATSSNPSQPLPAVKKPATSIDSEPTADEVTLESSPDDDLVPGKLKQLNVEDQESQLPTPSKDSANEAPISPAVSVSSVIAKSKMSDFDAEAGNNCDASTEDRSLVSSLSGEDTTESTGLNPATLQQSITNPLSLVVEVVHSDTEHDNEAYDVHVDIDDNSGVAVNRAAASHLLDGEDIHTATINTHPLYQEAQGQRLSSENEILEDRHTDNESDDNLGFKEAVIAGEDAVPNLSCDLEQRKKPFKLKIGSYYWNAPSPFSHDGIKREISHSERNTFTSTLTLEIGTAKEQRHIDTRYDDETPSQDDDTGCTKGPVREDATEVQSIPGKREHLTDLSTETPPPVLAGLEDAANAPATSCSTFAPSSPAKMKHLEDEQGSTWPETLLKQQPDLPPFPYKEETSVNAPVLNSNCLATLAPSPSMEVPIKDNTLQEERAVDQESLLKQDTPHEMAESPFFDATETSKTLSPRMTSVSERDEPSVTDPILKTTRATPNKRTRTPRADRKELISNSAAEYIADGAPESEDEAPAKKRPREGKSAKAPKKPSSFQTSSALSRRQASTKRAASHRQQSVTNAPQQAIEEKIVDRELTELELQAELQKEMDEDYVDSASDGVPPTENASFERPRHPAETYYGKRVTRGDAEKMKDGGDHTDESPVQGDAQARDQEEMLVDVEPDATVVHTRNTTRAKGKGKAKAVTTKATVGPKTAASRARQLDTAKTTPGRKAASKTLAAAATTAQTDTDSAEAVTKRSKFGFKPPNGRKRKSTEANEAADVPQASSGPTKRQTRHASAQLAMETNVAKRTRGARKNAGD